MKLSFVSLDWCGAQRTHLCGLVCLPPTALCEKASPAPPCGKSRKVTKHELPSCHREMTKRPFSGLETLSLPCFCTSVWSACVKFRLLGMIAAAGILIDFAQVDVPFVPVDFLHSEKTKGHMLQLLSAV